MKKRLLGAFLLMLCMMLFAPLAHAEEIRISVTATPTELSGFGTVKFTFSISNFSDYELSDIVIGYNGNSYDDLRQTVIPPNQSVQDFSLDLQVSESQLGKPIPFAVTGVRNGEPITQEVTVTIARSADPIITVARTSDATMAKQGDKIKLTYKFSNDTVYDMRDIMLIDEDVIDEPIKLDILQRGDSSSFDKQFTMGAESVISAPVVTYTVNGKTKSFSGIAPLTLESLLVQLSMNIDAGTPTAAGVQFNLEIKNTGNQDISGISITDERSNLVNSEPFSLKTGQSSTFSYLVVPLMSEPLRNVKFLLKGTDSLNQPYTLESSKSYEVYPFVDDSQIHVTARAETVTPWSGDAGKVIARVIVTNHSTVALTNVSVSESTIGVMKAYDTLATGETSFDQEILLGSPRNLQFVVKGMDPTGMSRELANCTLPVAYGAGDAQQAATPVPEISQSNLGALGFLSSTISRVLVILGILMVIAFIVLIVLSAMERGRGSLFVRYDDEEDEDDEAGDELDRIFEQPPRAHHYRDDAEEVLSYTQRMQAQTRRTVVPPQERSRPVAPEQSLAAIPLPPAQPQPPMVTIEYEDDPVRSFFTEADASANRRPGEYGPRTDTGEISYIDYEEEEQLRMVRTPRRTDRSEIRHAAAPPAAAAYEEPSSNSEYAEQCLDDDAGMTPFDKSTAAAPLHTPKVIVSKPQASVRPQSRNVVRHVRAQLPKEP